MYKACIFDLDGTLLYTLPTIVHYNNRALKKFGFNEISIDKCKQLCRLPYKEFYENLLLFGGCPEQDVKKYRDAVGSYDQKIYMEDILYLTEPYPGTIRLLEALKVKDIKLAVLTNKPDQIAKSVIGATFDGIFDFCVGQTPTNIPKPDPRSLWNVIEGLSLTREECVYVGDTDIDLITAKEAGVFSIAASWGYQPAYVLQEYEPGAIISQPEEILKYF